LFSETFVVDALIVKISKAFVTRREGQSSCLEIFIERENKKAMFNKEASLNIY